MSGIDAALPSIRQLMSVPPPPPLYFSAHGRALPDAIYFITEIAQQRCLGGQNNRPNSDQNTQSAPGNPHTLTPAKRSITPLAQIKPASPADTPPLSPAQPPSPTPLAVLADTALGIENSPMSRGEQAKPQPPTLPITTMPPPKRARPANATPAAVAARVPVVPGLQPGVQVYADPRPVPKPAPKPAAALVPPPMIWIRTPPPGGFLADINVLSVSLMINDMEQSMRAGQFPSPHLKHIIDTNLAFSKRVLTPQESSAWQKARDAYFSKELGSSATSEELENKLQQLVEMEAQLPQQAPECFRIKELDLSGFIKHCDFLETLAQLCSLEKLTLGWLSWAKDASKLSKLPALHSLSIKNCALKVTDWKNFPTLPSLISLSLGKCNTLETKCLRFLPGQIQTLELDNPTYLNGQSLPALCEHFRQLRRLKLVQASLSPSSDLSPLRQLTKLTSLVLRTQSLFSFELNKEQLLQLAQKGAFPQLAELELGLMNEKVDPDTKNALKRLPAIKSLILHYKTEPTEVWKAPAQERMETEVG